MQYSHYEMLYRHEIGHWWYRVRRQIVHDLLRSYFGDRTDLRLADIGCGTGALTKELEQYGECTGIDLSEHAVAFCRSRGVRDVRPGSAEQTGLKDGSLDAVICIDVLEHLPKDKRGITEIHRVLKQGGIAIIFVPAFRSLWGVTDELSHHYRRYRLPELARKFEPKDFTILRKSYFNTFLFPFIAMVRMTVRLLHIPMKSENATGTGMLNEFFYRVFDLERRAPSSGVSFPFGVSILLVVQKK